MMLNKFVIDFFLVCRTIFEIKTLVQNFAARWRCKWFHCVAHDHFTIPRYHFYSYIAFRLEIIGVATDFSGHTVFKHVNTIIKAGYFIKILAKKKKEKEKKR